MTVTIGLISDTHLPDRCRALPPTVFDALAGVDLVLHAGDVGALSVLDELAAIAPVIAVHGNDETEGAEHVLPFQQVMFVAGRRVLLTHGHIPDRAQEHANRKVDDWQPKLARWADQAHTAGASIIVYGHTHIPWFIEFDGVWIINPGAIASGSHHMRQGVQTVARMTLSDATHHNSAPPDVAYVNLADLRPYEPAVDVNAGFVASIINEVIATPDLMAHYDWFFQEVYPLAPDPVRNAVRRVMFRCHDGEIALMDTPDLVAELLNAPDVPGDAKARVEARFR